MKKFMMSILGILASLLIEQGFLNPSTCGKISAGLSFDCNYPLMGGVKDNLILINFEDIDSVTRNGSNSQIIEAMDLHTLTKGYLFEGKNNSVEPQTALVKQRYAEVYDHEVTFKVFLSTPAAKLQLEKMVLGRLVAIVQNNHINSAGDSVYEIYGLGSGLVCTELTRVLSDAESQGAYNVVLKTSEQSKESHLPNTFFKTSFAATKVLVDALLV